MSYQCPLCHHALTTREGGLECENNHQFDRAKEGYVNLMPVQHKRSKEPGDNVDMMQARRRFLASDQYHKLREAVSELCIKHTANTPRQILDIGCGEGYYTAYVAEKLAALSSCTTCYGLDISKVAIRYAAKRYTSQHMQFCVASSQRLPFAEHSLDAVVRIYAPCEASELARVLTTAGVIITVTPAARHLYQLKALIYDNVHLHDEAAESIHGFELVEEAKLNYDMTLTGEQADDLLQMTPLAWKAQVELRTQLQAATQLMFEADFMLRVYKRVAN
ncbi:23S rRNA (guanine(745)-N(1))-methyltransferase [Oceanisphaera profunda]|uniref:23S rRNA (Guanine(745)-N(1))-methyltransferase n=1 Tax=Oceanisphaera profunda TaxID=1416627 RepID=A0A1Y0D4I0_9GAMM|nr:23S rRNA (guanine(745)-N(1))-methyltransferase [Oceanisphaera profunda]ART82106.1 23S rRNA (guanine(745)-N(1))-methyltransferase [Oceanisphaera profunda]